MGFFRLFGILQTGSIHPEAQNWAERVAANGGTVSADTLKAVSDFCKETASIRSLFLRLNLFCGNNLNAALVPLFLGEAPGIVYGNTVDTNINFVAGDYTERGTNGGLIGNGVSKYLDTGFVPNSVAAMGLNDSSLSVYSKTNISGGFIPIGSGTNSTTNLIFINPRNGSNLFTRSINNNSSVTTANSNSLGHFFVSRITDLFTYINGILFSNSTVATTSKNSNSIHIFSLNTGTPGFYDQRRNACYHIGKGFKASQVSIFYNALQKFQTSLNRQV